MLTSALDCDNLTSETKCFYSFIKFKHSIRIIPKLKQNKTRKRKGVAISVTVDENIIALIDELCGGKNNGRDQALGRMGGRNHWVRSLIYKELNVELPKDPRGSKPVEPLTAKEMKKPLGPDDICNFVQSLSDRGYSYQQIAEILDSKNIPTKRGGKWHRETVRQMLNTHKKKKKDPVFI